MANIPGTSGYVQPGVFARDIVRSTGTSAAGTGRTLVIMGEGINSSTLVLSAAGGGLDGDAEASPTGDPKGRFFKIAGAPLVSGRTEVYVTSNGVQTSLFGKQEVISSSALDSKYDFRLDIDNGYLELQGPSIMDQNGSLYSTSSTTNSGGGMYGNGVIVDGVYGDYNLLQIQDDTLPNGTVLTLKCTSVSRDSNNLPIAGTAQFELRQKIGSGTNSVIRSGIKLTYFEETDGAISGNATPSDGYPVLKSSDYSAATPVYVSAATTTNTLEVASDLVTPGLAMVGDYIEVDGYEPQEIISITYSSSSSKTTIIVKKYVFTTTAPASWEIKATDLFMADHRYLTDATPDSNSTDGIDDGYDLGGPFNSGYVGSIIAITSGEATGLYKIKAFNSSRMVRVHKIDDDSLAFPSLESTDGLSLKGISYRILEDSDCLLFGIKEGSTPFNEGDKFTLKIKSRVLSKGDSLSVKYISEQDINFVEDFESVIDIQNKFGDPSLENTISLGSRLAIANGAPFVRIIQCKPSIARRTSSFLVEEKNSLGVGGVTACGGDADLCEVDDLMFPIPVPITGLRAGRPSADSNVSIFAIRKGKEIQLPLSKFDFYNSQLETEVQKNVFVTSSDYSGAYTVVNTDVEILGSGDDASLFTDSSPGIKAFFTTDSFDFDSKNSSESTTIVLTSVEIAGSSSNTLLTSKDDIAEAIFGSGNSAAGVELKISDVIGDNLVEVVSKNLNGSLNYSFEPNIDIVNIQYFIRDEEDSANKSAAILLNKSVISSGLLKKGDGLKISYVDVNDEDYYDYGWLSALERLESIDCQMIVPLPTNTKSMIFRNVLSHCEVMSTIANKKERVALFGAINGVDENALTGLKLVAVENIGIIEGIQGDDPEEVLSGNIEDLANYKLTENFTSNRCQYFFPDQIVYNGSIIDGYYIAAAAAGWFAANQFLALPLTNKVLSGFSILQSKVFSQSKLNSLGSVGATVLQPSGAAGGRVLASRTTSISGYIEDEEPSIMFIRDQIKQALRNLSAGYIGRVQDQNTMIDLNQRVGNFMKGLIASKLITSFRGLKVSQDKVDPRQINIFVGYTPAYPVNYVYIEIEVGAE